MNRLVRKWKREAPGAICCAYEGGPCGCGLQRDLEEQEVDCQVIAAIFVVGRYLLPAVLAYSSPATPEAAALGRVLAVYVSAADFERVQGPALTLQRLYPRLDVFEGVRTLREQGG